MAHISSLFEKLLPFAAFSALAAGTLPLVGPGLRSIYVYQPVNVSFETLGICLVLIAFGGSYFWLHNKGPENRVKRALIQPNLKMIVMVLAIATAALAVAGFAIPSGLFKWLSLVPFALLVTFGVALLMLTAIEDMAAESIPAYIENPHESLWLKKTEARWKQNFRRTCFIFGGALGLTSLFMWGVGHYDPSAMPSMLLFEILGGGAVLCTFAGWITGSFITPEDRQE